MDGITINDAMKEVINNIPCKKNCNVCLRNGMTSCYEPEENYVANELFEKNNRDDTTSNLN